MGHIVNYVRLLVQFSVKPPGVITFGCASVILAFDHAALYLTHGVIPEPMQLAILAGKVLLAMFLAAYLCSRVMHDLRTELVAHIARSQTQATNRADAALEREVASSASRSAELQNQLDDVSTIFTALFHDQRERDIA